MNYDLLISSIYKGIKIFIWLLISEIFIQIY